jgi:hypothetical protein
MSQTFVRESDGQWLHEIAPTKCINSFPQQGK